MRILGISAYYHDSAAVLVEDGVVVAAVQEERFSRRKHDASFPTQAVRYCLEHAGRALADVDAVAFHEKPLLKFERMMASFLAVAPRGVGAFVSGVPPALRPMLLPRLLIRDELAKLGDLSTGTRLFFSQHHLSHAASAFFPSPFDEAAVLTVDGVGEWATASIGHGRGASLSVARELHFPHSLGLFYSAMTWFLGFAVNDGEYKLMGLAPYGDESSARFRRFRDVIGGELLSLGEDGALALDVRRFRFLEERRAVDEAEWASLLGMPRRSPDAPMGAEHADLALAVQRVTEEAIVRMAREARRLTGSPRLCLAGGVALNCVANRRIVDAGLFEDVWIQPAAGDAGGALGAALALHHVGLGAPRSAEPADSMQGALLGPEFGSEEIERCARRFGARFERFGSPADAAPVAARLLADGQVLGWFQGRAEWGPRALGNRSILADPRRPEMQARLNVAVKHRETFRPFAPAVLEEDAREWFELDRPSPYMLLTAPVASGHQRAPDAAQGERSARSDIPAVTHVDGSARLQTVASRVNPVFAALLREFKVTTGCGVLVNTSFNVAGEPIVTTPEDAYRCFRAAELDALVMGPFLFRKERQPAAVPAREGAAERGGQGAAPSGRARDLERVAALAAVLAVFGAVKGWRGPGVAAAALLLAGVALPRATRAVVAGVDAVADAAGGAIRGVVLSAFFVLVVTPIAWLRRAAGAGDEGFERGRPVGPVWIVREHVFDPSDLEGPG
jgi:carbamoyltransferase